MNSVLNKNIYKIYVVGGWKEVKLNTILININVQTTANKILSIILRMTTISIIIVENVYLYVCFSLERDSSVKETIIFEEKQKYLGFFNQLFYFHSVYIIQ